jgi:hypothetical protein
VRPTSISGDDPLASEVKAEASEISSAGWACISQPDGEYLHGSAQSGLSAMQSGSETARLARTDVTVKTVATTSKR